MRALSTVILASALFGVPSPTPAQEDFAAEKARVLSSVPFSPLGDAGSGFVVEAGQANDRAEISLQWANGLGLKLGAPTDEDSGEGSFTNLDGLADNLTLALRWSWLLDPEIATSELVARREAICAQKELQLQPADCRADTELEKALTTPNRSPKDVEKILAGYRRDWLPSRFLWSIFLEGKAGYKNFEYFNAGGPQEESDLYSGSLSAALVGSHGAGRLLFGVTYEDAKKEQEKVIQSCTAVEGAPTLEECKSLPLGSPSAAKSFVVRAEYRYFLGRVAIAPLASYNVDDEVLALELPLYFLHDSDDLLTGGIRLGWRDDDGDLKASIFVGKPLGLL